jgi:hypothetical protein
MNTASDGVGLMSTILTPQKKEQVKKMKVDRMPQLRKALATALRLLEFAAWGPR